MGNSPLLKSGLKQDDDWCPFVGPSPTDLFQCSRWRACWRKVGQLCLPRMIANTDLQVSPSLLETFAGIISVLDLANEVL